MGIESVGIKIAELRKSKGMTQEQLANSLHVTDKAASKWETGGGYPDISLLPNIAEVLSVSIDYLLTGKEPELTPISKLELCAKKDDLDLYEELKIERKIFDVHDENNKSLLSYVIQYQSTNLFDKLVHESEMNRPNNDPFSKIQHLLVITAIATNNIFYLSKYRMQFENHHRFQDPLMLKPEFLSRAADMIVMNPKVTNETVEFLISKHGDLMLHHLYPFLFQSAIINDRFTFAEKLVDKAVTNNQELSKTMKKIREKFVTTRLNYWIEDGFVILDSGNKTVGTFVCLKKETISACIEKSQYTLARKLNDINKTAISNSICEAVAFGEDVFLKHMINNDNTLNEIDKQKKLVKLGRFVDVDKLIKLNNYILYQEMISEPSCIEETFYELLNIANWRELQILSLDLKDKYPWLPNAVLTMNVETILKANLRSKNRIPSKEELDEEKRKITFKQIISHKDIEFFALACKKDLKNIDWALDHVDPSRFDIIKLLLDNGAKLHKRVSQNDGWGNDQGYDEIDKIGTEILKKKINEIVEANQNE
jgi:transcriptional regulator with XRE-family HTH domain